MWRRVLMAVVTLVVLSLPALSDAANPTVSEVLETYLANRQRLDPLHVQLQHLDEYTDAYRAKYRRDVERQEAVVDHLRKAMSQTTSEDFKKANPQLPPGYTLGLVLMELESQLKSSRLSAKQRSPSEEYVELFQKGEAYQIRNPTHLDSFKPTNWVFPSGPLTEKTLVTTYKDMSFFSWSPHMTPHGKIVNGGQPDHIRVTAKHYDSNGNRPIPAYSSFAAPGSYDCHPIDAFFHQTPESYKISGTETIDGRELLIVEVAVPMDFWGGYTRPNGESYQLRTIDFYKAWLDMDRGALPVKFHIWQGNEETNFDTLSSSFPTRIMTTEEIREVIPGHWYPSITVVEKFDRDAEKMPKAPLSQQGEEWELYCAECAKVPYVVHKRETWRCHLVEVQPALNDDFFVLPVPEGAKMIDRDEQEKFDVFGDLPAAEFVWLAKITGKLWFVGPFSAYQECCGDE